MFIRLGIIACLILWTLPTAGQDKDVLNALDKKADHYSTLAHQIWDLAELGYKEHQSSELLQAELKDAGFTVEAGVAGIPTAFLATYGSGSPVIGVLAEFDALPGVSQAAVPVPQKIEGKKNGHACGHHLFGTASVAAGISAKEWLQKNKGKGTIRVYGTPAEEGGAGKVYMVRGGLFDDVDAVLHWHPGASNQANMGSSLANKSGKFRFYGIASHAAGAPERGRSALDGVEAMNDMVNMMREHVPSDSRIHYVITSGGEAPNVVPAFAEVYYYVRHPDAATVEKLFDRVKKCAEGAALGTETEMKVEVIHGIYNLVSIDPIQKLVYDNLVKVGGVNYNAEERAFAEKISESFGDRKVDVGQAAKVSVYADKGRSGGSTDVGDVSWVVPTAGMSAATWVPGSSAHSWQAVAAGGTSIGHKGMMVAAKTLALSAIELFQSPDVIAKAKSDLIKFRGTDFKYIPLLGDRPPPLDYRNGLE